MNEENEIILSGPPLKEPIFHGSLAEFLIPKWKSYPKDKTMQVDGTTGESLTSEELLTQSIRAAEGLKALGLQQEDVVAFTARNGKNIFIGALATMLQAGTLAPIDPALKVYELKYLFNIIQPKFVFSEEECSKDVTEALNQLNLNSTIIIVDAKEDVPSPFIKFEDILEEVDTKNYEPLPVDNPDTQLLVIACSSGTSGFPKGVGLTHKNIIYQLYGLQQIDLDTVLQLTQFFWVSGILTVFASIYLCMERVHVRRFDELVVFKAIEKYKPKWIFMSPAELGTLIKHPDFDNYDVSSIRAIIAGGAPVSQILMNETKKKWKTPVFISQGYGMTELSGVITEFPRQGHTASVGVLVPGIQLKVVDIETGKSLGSNQKGEFCFKSPGIMKGYIRNEEATKEVIDEKGWLHTGDLGYYDEDGYLYIVDRIKEFIKYRTWQVPPAELEALLEFLPGVAEVGVAGIPNKEDIYHPMAIVIKKEGSTITEDDIIKYVADNMSDFKQLRAGVKFVDHIPRTPTGKIKRPLLKELAKKLYNEDPKNVNQI